MKRPLTTPHPCDSMFRINQQRKEKQMTDIDLSGYVEVIPFDPTATIVLQDGVVKSAGEIQTQLNSLSTYKDQVFSFRAKVQNLEDTLKQYLDDEEIDEDVATEIAKIFGISIDKTVEVTVNVEFTLSLVMPRGEDIDDVVQNLSFSVDSYSSDADIESEDYNIVDWNESRGW